MRVYTCECVPFVRVHIRVHECHVCACSVSWEFTSPRHGAGAMGHGAMWGQVSAHRRPSLRLGRVSWFLAKAERGVQSKNPKKERKKQGLGHL